MNHAETPEVPVNPDPHASDPDDLSRGISRRRVLQIGVAGVVAVGGGFAGFRLLDDGPSTVGPTSAAVRSKEAARARSGKIVRRELRAAPATMDFAGRRATTWAYDNSVPGPEIRVTAGDELRLSLNNDLPDPTSVHWHGVALRNDMDGVPGLTQRAIRTGTGFDYAFTVPDPGTYWFHPHVGVQLDTGLMAPLVVEDPNEPGGYDDEVVLVLDDWTDGVGSSPKAILDRMRKMGMSSMSGMDMEGMSGMMGMPSAREPLGSDTGDVAYPFHLINGKVPDDPFVVTSKPGRRIRFRLINGGSDTAYRFAVGGHRLQVTHADGFPVRPVDVDTLILGMGERYDVTVTVGDGAFPITAVPEGKDDAPAMGVLRSAKGRTPSADTRPAELKRRLLTYADLVPTEAVALKARKPDRVIDMALQMAGKGRRWLIDGRTYGEHQPIRVESGERVRLRLNNKSMMFHPMHLHGHTFAVVGRGHQGFRKDTVNVLPMQKLEIDLQTDNPGQWLAHCHNVYHGELGMMTVVSYTS